jgi:hypothetical protein
MTPQETDMTSMITRPDKIRQGGVVGHFAPHVMFYAPYFKNVDIRSEGQAGGGPAFVAGEGTPSANPDKDFD